ncbi:MAG: GNAT family N-acetyltransferase [Asticcacaulis sp.]|nr:GNAT family N-acetyltransferase [Asticcacaulis sp.]
MTDITDFTTSPNQTELLALNNAFAHDTSYLEQADWDHLVSQARFGYAINTDGFLIAFDEKAGYDSPNFLWHRERLQRFAYVDRVVIAAAAQGRGLGRKLYEQLALDARAAGFPVIACEVNIDPPNTTSIAFHEKLGFQRVGDQRLANGKTVGYYVLNL